VHVEATPENTTVDAITQNICKGEKTELIIKLITDGNWQQILVFTRTKQGANKLTEYAESRNKSQLFTETRSEQELKR
jgi:ATP-dependent RNA helicase RhlE